LAWQITPFSSGELQGLVIILWRVQSRKKPESECTIPPLGAQSSQELQPRFRSAEKWVNEELAFYRRYGYAQNRWYWLCRVPIIVFAASIPIVSLIIQNKDAATKAAAVLGATIAILEALSTSFRFRDNWLTSIAARDRLLLEGRLCAAVAGPYSGMNEEKRCSLFVERAVGHIQAESYEWSRNQLRKDLQQAAEEAKSRQEPPHAPPEGGSDARKP